MVTRRKKFSKGNPVSYSKLWSATETSGDGMSAWNMLVEDSVKHIYHPQCIYWHSAVWQKQRTDYNCIYAIFNRNICDDDANDDANNNNNNDMLTTSLQAQDCFQAREIIIISVA